MWEEESYGAENIIAVHIRHIREKIEINPREPKYMKMCGKKKVMGQRTLLLCI